MNELEEFNDDFIRDIVKKGAINLPNDDFENEMMLKLHSDSGYKKEVSAKLILSMRFFIGGVVLGVVLMLSLLFWESMSKYNNKTLVIMALFVIGVMAILNIDNYKRLINKYSF